MICLRSHGPCGAKIPSNFLYSTLGILCITTYSIKIQIRDIIREILFVMSTDC